ncbi:hypothetical protein [Actinomycetospora atypica]|uniref:Uncharacterized protein n=1 Tax=Actinomycetospora atypica TaxID=1290095 RepID=A0ABV9YS89_9PSEU
MMRFEEPPELDVTRLLDELELELSREEELWRSSEESDELREDSSFPESEESCESEEDEEESCDEEEDVVDSEDEEELSSAEAMPAETVRPVATMAVATAARRTMCMCLLLGISVWLRTASAV